MGDSSEKKSKKSKKSKKEKKEKKSKRERDARASSPPRSSAARRPAPPPPPVPPTLPPRAARVARVLGRAVQRGGDARRARGRGLRRPQRDPAARVARGVRRRRPHRHRQDGQRQDARLPARCSTACGCARRLDDARRRLIATPPPRPPPAPPRWSSRPRARARAPDPPRGGDVRRVRRRRRPVAVYGGAPMRDQIEKLRASAAQMTEKRSPPPRRSAVRSDETGRGDLGAVPPRRLGRGGPHAGHGLRAAAQGSVRRDVRPAGPARSIPRIRTRSTEIRIRRRVALLRPTWPEIRAQDGRRVPGEEEEGERRREGGGDHHLRGGDDIPRRRRRDVDALDRERELQANASVTQSFIHATDDEKDQRMYDFLCTLQHGSRVVAVRQHPRPVRDARQNLLGPGLRRRRRPRR